MAAAGLKRCEVVGTGASIWLVGPQPGDLAGSTAWRFSSYEYLKLIHGESLPLVRALRSSSMPLDTNPRGGAFIGGTMRYIRVLGLSACCCVLYGCAPAVTAAPAQGGMQATDLRSSMRKLWADHVIWTRQYIVAAVADDPGAQTAAARLLRNQEDIGNAVVPFYGQAAGTQLTALLKDHINIAVDLLTAAKAGNTAQQNAADQRWRRNADEIATFLSAANPNWPKATLLSMLNEHLDLTTQEAVARLQRNWDADVAAFDRIFSQAMEMADALTDGIRRQFPGRA